MGVSRAAETFLQLRCKHTPHPPPPRFMYLLNSGAETLFVVPGVPKQLVLPSNTSDSKTTKREMDGKMQPPSGVGGMGGRKRQNLTLDLNSASPKKNKVQNLLTSPDVQMLKLTSPELEKFLSQNPSLATPTPSSYGFPKSVTEEQMQYAKGFEEALEKIKYQEKIKLERKRLRNRQAAAKCRKRKLERISLLDDRVAQLKTENTDLAAVVKKMKSSVAALKQEVLDHVNSGCEIRMSDATVFS